MKIAALLIILLLPFIATAHGFAVELDIDPGVLPGSPKYILERVGEWFTVNILTLSTKRKERKKLELARERLAEFKALIEQGSPKVKHLRAALAHYQNLLRQAEDMAEKIIFLDGAQIPLAEEIESTTRIHEQVIAELLEEINPQFAGFVQEALITARNENEKIFKFMVKNYQFTEADIRKHQNVLEQHFQIVETRLEKPELIQEARQFQKAGLNIEAYELVRKAKNLIY